MIRAAVILVAGLVAQAAAGAPVELLVEERARDSLGAEMPASGEVRVTVSSKPVAEAMLISAYWMDQATGQFIANVVTEEGATHRIGGYALVIQPVPVPLRRLMPGEVITDGDIGTVDMPVARLGSFTISDADKLVGKEVRSLLAKGRPVMVQAVQEPLVIARGEEVSIIYRDGPLQLSAPGRALRDAHAGQDIKVVNLASNSTLAGIAVAHGRVEVGK